MQFKYYLLFVLSGAWSLWYFSNYTVKPIGTSNAYPSQNSCDIYSDIMWDTSKQPWKSMPSCALLTKKMVDDGETWCDDFSSDKEVHIYRSDEFMKNGF